MGAKRASTQSARFHQLTREVSRQLDLPADDHVVEHVASLRLGRESLVAKMISGDDIDAGQLLRFDEALAKYMPASKPVQIALTHLTHCPSCGVALAKGVPAVAPKEASPSEVGIRAAVEHEPLQATVSVAAEGIAAKTKPKPAKPAFVESEFVKDSRPNAPASLVGSVVWSGSNNGRGAL